MTLEPTRLDPVRLQDKANIAYTLAREAAKDPLDWEYATLWQVLAAYQSALARRHAGVTE
jgi:hypothetical protein